MNDERIGSIANAPVESCAGLQLQLGGDRRWNGYLIFSRQGGCHPLDLNMATGEVDGSGETLLY